MFLEQLIQGLGNRRAIDNARAASTELARRRVEREEVELYLHAHNASWQSAAARPPVAAQR